MSKAQSTLAEQYLDKLLDSTLEEQGELIKTYFAAWDKTPGAVIYGEGDEATWVYFPDDSILCFNDYEWNTWTLTELVAAARKDPELYVGVLNGLCAAQEAQTPWMSRKSK